MGKLNSLMQLMVYIYVVYIYWLLFFKNHKLKYTIISQRRSFNSFLLFDIFFFFHAFISYYLFANFHALYIVYHILHFFIRNGSRTAATSKMELFKIIVNSFQPLTFITKCSILDVAAVLDPLCLLCDVLHRVENIYWQTFLKGRLLYLL